MSYAGRDGRASERVWRGRRRGDGGGQERTLVDVVLLAARLLLLDIGHDEYECWMMARMSLIDRLLYVDLGWDDHG